MTGTMRPIDETYADVEKLIYHACHQFQRKFGGDIEEMISIGNEKFMSSYEKFDSSQGSFSTFLYINISNALQDHHWHEWRRFALSLDNEMSDGRSYANEVRDDSVSGFDLSQFAEDMSEDAVMILKLVLDSPAELANIAIGKGGNPRNWRSSIRDWLESMGWSNERVAEGFEEIRGVLAGV